MYKKIILFWCCLTVLFSSHAQIMLTVEVPATGVIQKSQLWNMTLTYTGKNPIYVYVGLSLLSAADNRPLMTAITKSTLLSSGSRQLKAADITPITYQYLSPSFNVDNNPDGFLPIGNYKACYTIYKSWEYQGTPLAEDCIPLEIQPLSPPLLTAPADETVVETPYPQFSWLPPMPMNLFSNLKYELVVTEVLPGQSTGKSIQQNLPVYNASGNVPFNNYPASNKALDTGRLYAWRVNIKNDNDFITQSDIWTFKVSRPKASIVSLNGNAYIKLKRGAETGYTECKGSLRFAYDNEAGDSLLSYRLTDAGEESGHLLKTGQLAVQRGRNFLEIDLLREEKLPAGNVYLLQVINSRKEVWGVKFTYHKSEITE